MKSLSTKQPTSCTSGGDAGKRKAQEVGGSEHGTSYFLHSPHTKGRRKQQTAPTNSQAQAPVSDAPLELLRRPDEGQFSGEKLRAQNPRLYESIVRFLQEGGGIRLAAQIFKASPHTVLAIGEANGLTAAKMKTETAAVLRRFVRLGAERLLENVDSLPLGQLAINVGIAADKAASMEGDLPPTVIEHRSLNVNLSAALADLRRKMSGGELILPATETDKKAGGQSE